MNIIEAIKSGRRFKRPNWPKFASEADMRDHVDGHYEITHDSLLADDWEVEAAPVTITREQFNAAWLEAIEKAGGRNLTYGNFECFSKLVAKELGL